MYIGGDSTLSWSNDQPGDHSKCFFAIYYPKKLVWFNGIRALRPSHVHGHGRTDAYDIITSVLTCYAMQFAQSLRALMRCKGLPSFISNAPSAVRLSSRGGIVPIQNKRTNSLYPIYRRGIMQTTAATASDGTAGAGAVGGDAPITAESKCQGCKGLTESMKAEDVEMQRAMLIPQWRTTDDGLQLTRSLKLRNCASALIYVNRIGEVAEAEGHHPDITIRSYNWVDIMLSTHSVGGITENDLIMAVKIDTIAVPSVKRLPS